MINSNVEESVNGHNIVKLYGQEEKFVEAFRKQNRLLYESSFKAMAVSNLIQPLSRFFTNLNYVIVALGGALRVISGQETLFRTAVKNTPGTAWKRVSETVWYTE